MLSQNSVVFLTPEAIQGYKSTAKNDHVRASVGHVGKGIIQEQYPSGLLNVKFQLKTIGYLTLNVTPEELTSKPACPTCKGTGHSRGAYGSYAVCLDCEGYGYHQKKELVAL